MVDLLSMLHVVWDWNGTLFDDLAITVDAVSEGIVGLGGEHVTVAQYRASYERPVIRTYERILGRALSADEWSRTADEFRERYLQRLDDATLSVGARDAIDLVSRCGGTQSILSMSWHDLLQSLVNRFGLGDRMIRVEGTGTDAGALKSPLMGQHIEQLARLNGLRSACIVAIGDSVDDANAARDSGIACVLYSGGTHSLESLLSGGTQATTDLVEAVEMAATQILGSGDHRPRDSGTA